MRRSRDIVILLGIALIVASVALLLPLPTRPTFEPGDLVQPAENLRIGGLDCHGNPFSARQNAEDAAVRCAQAIEDHRVAIENLRAQRREARAGELQAVLGYEVAWMVLVGTVAGILTVFIALAAARYASKAATAAEATLDHARGTAASDLRPWLRMDIQPGTLKQTEECAFVDCVVELRNLGRSPATRIFAGARLFLPSETQEVADYFVGPFEPPDGWFPRTLLPDGESRLEIQTAPRPWAEPASDARRHEAEDQPVLAVRVVYDKGNGEIGRTCQSYWIELAQRRGRPPSQATPRPQRFSVKPARIDYVS
jgi:hypothetical protein